MKLFIALLVMSCISTYAKTQSFIVNKDDKDRKVIEGPISRQEWVEITGWGAGTKSNNIQNMGAVDSIKIDSKGRDLKFYIFSGSWCEDSEKGLPEIYEVLDSAGIEDNNILLFGINHDKIEPSGTAASFIVMKAPTLIIVDSGKELGRIEEFPVKNWGTDILGILKKGK